MSSTHAFDTAAHESRGRAASVHCEPQEAGSRGLFSLAGLLLGSVAAMIKQLANGEREVVGLSSPEATDDQEATPANDLASAPPLTRPQGQASGNGNDAAALAPSGSGAASRPQHAKFHNDGPEPLREAQLSTPHLTPIPLLPANDNSGLRLPFAPPGPATTENAGSASTSGGAEGRTSDSDPSGDGGPAAPAEDDPVPSEERNRAPIVTSTVNLGQINFNTAIVIGLTDLLRHASDPDGDALAVVGLSASSGELTEIGSGTWLFTPAADDVGEVTFSYVISDGALTVGQIAELDLVELREGRQFGTESDDILVGTAAADDIAALSGSDVVNSLAGDDSIDAGEGDDIISSGGGNDLIFAGAGNDMIDAGGGHDIVFGGAGNDIIFGGDGDDVVRGEAGNDVLSGGAGDDVVDGGDGDDAFITVESLVRSSATAADLPPGAPEVVSEPTGTNPTVVAEAGAPAPNPISDGSDNYVGGAGIDTLDLGGTSADAIVDLTSGMASSNDIGSDFVSEIENVVGSSGGDTITGSSVANVVDAGPGADEVATLDGDDTIVATAGDGNDTYDGGAGIDTLDLGGTSADAVIDLSSGTAQSGVIGSDSLRNIENVVSGGGNDTIIADAAHNELTGGDGQDTFVFKSASDAQSDDGAPDIITDFEVGDKIDLSLIDGDEKGDGIQELEFKGQADHFEKAAEIIYKYRDSEDGEHTIILVNNDDDLDEDFSIDLIGHHELAIEDFYGLS